MKYELVLTGKFKKGLKTAKKRGLNISLLDFIVDKCFKEYRWRKSIRIIH